MVLRSFNKNWLAAVLFAGHLGIFGASWLAGLADQDGAILSTGTIALFFAVLGLCSIAERLDWVAAGAMATGAWSLVAPVLFGFTGDPAFWIHMIAGLLAMIVGIIAAELSDSRPPHSMA